MRKFWKEYGGWICLFLVILALGMAGIIVCFKDPTPILGPF